MGNITSAESRRKRTSDNISSPRNSSDDNIETTEGRSRMKVEDSSRRNRTTSSDSSLAGNTNTDTDSIEICESRSRKREEMSSKNRRERSSRERGEMSSREPEDMNGRERGEMSSRKPRKRASLKQVGDWSWKHGDCSSRKEDDDSSKNHLGGRRKKEGEGSSIKHGSFRSKKQEYDSSKNHVDESGKKLGEGSIRRHGDCGSKKQYGGSSKNDVRGSSKNHGDGSSRKHGEGRSMDQGEGRSSRDRYISSDDSLVENTVTGNKSSSERSTADKKVNRGKRKTKESKKYRIKDRDTSLEKSGTTTDSNESNITESSVDRHVNDSRRSTHDKRKFKTKSSDWRKQNVKTDSSEGSSDDDYVDRWKNDGNKRSREKRSYACGDILKTSKNRKTTPRKDSSSNSRNRSNSIGRKGKSHHSYSRNNSTNNDNVRKDRVNFRTTNCYKHNVESSNGATGIRKRQKTFGTSRKEEKYRDRVSGCRSSFRKKLSDKTIRSESGTKYESENHNTIRGASKKFESNISHDEESSSDILSSGEIDRTSHSDDRSESNNDSRPSIYVTGQIKTSAQNISEHNTSVSNVSKIKLAADNFSKIKPSADNVSRSRPSVRSDIVKPTSHKERRNGDMKMAHHDYSEINKKNQHLSYETDLQIDEFHKMESPSLNKYLNTASSTHQHDEDAYLIGGSELLTLTGDEFNFIMGKDSSQQTRKVSLADASQFLPESFVDPLNPSPVIKESSSSSAAGSSAATSSVLPEVSDSSVGQYKWQFKDKDGIWITYGKVDPLKADIWPSITSEDMEKHYASPISNASMLIGHGTRNWVLSFRKMVQMDNRTLEKCPIRRILNTSGDCEEILVKDPSIYHEWQFKDESGDWITIGHPKANCALNPVSKTTSDYIEKQYLKNQVTASMLITINGEFFDLDFKRMTKTPLDFKNSIGSQPIRRIHKPSHKSNSKQDQSRDFPKVKAESKSSTAPMMEYEWYFKDEKNCWIKYGQPNTLNKVDCIPTISSDDIEMHFKEDPTKCMRIESQLHTYLLNFTKMTQTNIKTRVERPINRMLNDSKSGTEKHLPTEYGDQGNKNRNGMGFSPSNFTDQFPQHCEELLYDLSDNLTFSKNSLPSHWSPMSSNASWMKILVTPLSVEYNERLAAIRKTNPKCGVQNLYRVQNVYLWTAYINKKKYLEQQYPGIKFKEEYLFHGTDPKNVDAICDENVDWRLHGTKHGNAFGRGSYFSNSAQISAGYSKSRVEAGRNPRRTAAGTPLSGFYASALSTRSQQWSRFAATGSAPSGIFGAPHYPVSQPNTTGPLRVMFIVRVLIGRTIRGTTNTVTPPRDGSGVPYDTTVNNVASPNIFVKYDCQEYYPEYIVEFF